VATEVDRGVTPQGWEVEQTGIEHVPDSARRGSPRDLFWPWAAANLSFFGIAYGVYIVGFGLNLWQSLVAALVGALASFALVGLVAVAGTRAGAPTMTLGRAPYGYHGNKLPTLFSYISLVGWETVLVSLATLATGTVLGRLSGGLAGNGVLAVAFALIALITIVVGVYGYAVILRVQRWFTWAFVAMTAVYFAIMLPKLDLTAAAALPAGSTASLFGAIALTASGLGLGWVNCGADYSRYLPRSSAPAAVAGWTTFGASSAPIVLMFFGVLLTASNPGLAEAAGADPVGALAAPLPTWFLVPYLITAVLGFVAGAIMDIYSSGLNLLALGLRVPRTLAVLIDGVLMLLGGAYIVFFAPDFFGPFQAFLISIGVVMASWAAVFLVDLLLHRGGGYAESDLYRPSGVHGALNPAGVTSLVVASVIGLGTVTSFDPNVAKVLGYLLTDAARAGSVGASNLGVFLAFGVAGVLYAVLSTTVWRPRSRVTR
jgi:purine-cytosine permease-like protein